MLKNKLKNNPHNKFPFNPNGIPCMINKHPFNPNGIRCMAKHGKLINPNYQSGEFMDDDFLEEMVDKGLVFKTIQDWAS